MVRWVINNVNVTNRTFKNSRKEDMGSFTPKYFHAMYHLPIPQKVYDKAFLENFAKENEDPMKVVKEWNADRSKFKWDKTWYVSNCTITSTLLFHSNNDV